LWIDGLDALIKRFEGLRLAPYLCAAGVPTIGYGATLGADDKPVTLKHPPIDEATADALLQRDVGRFERGVDRMVRVALAESQRGALVSFSFNLGLGALQASTLLRRVNDLEWDDVPAQLLRWTRARGHVLPGLVARRAAEVGLWHSLPARARALGTCWRRRRQAASSDTTP
jgi:lysozyme